MYKSEYKRLSVQIPDVVKVIREQVLDEVLDAVKPVLNGIDAVYGDTDDVITTIENLKSK